MELKAKLLGFLVTQLFRLLTPELMKKLADRILDYCDEFVLGTKSTIDDKVVLPITSLIRKTFDIPD